MNLYTPEKTARRWLPQSSSPEKVDWDYQPRRRAIAFSIRRAVALAWEIPVAYEWHIRPASESFHSIPLGFPVSGQYNSCHSALRKRALPGPP